MKNFRNILYGVILVALGVIFGVNALGYADIDIFFDGWWTLFIIVPCLIDLLRGHNISGNLAGVSIGGLLLLICQDLVDPTTVWKLIVPVLLVCLGVRLIFKDAFGGKAARKIKDINSGNPSKKGCYAAFSSQNISFNSEVFNGCELTAAFGGVKCDLVFAEVPADCVITARVTFGGIDIILPSNVNVVVKSTSLFGGVSQKRAFPQIAGAPTIYVDAVCLFGGVDLK